MIKIILIVIVALIVIGLIIKFIELLRYILPVAGVIILLVLGFKYLGPMTMWKIIGIAVLCLIAIIVIAVVIRIIRENRLKRLQNYLRRNCEKKGLVTESSYAKLAPMFAHKAFPSGGYNLYVLEFVRDCEKRFFVDDISWVNSLLTIISKKGMADMLELSKEKLPRYQYTHESDTVRLIARAMERKCREDQRYECIKLNEDAVRKELETANVMYASDYLYAYKLKDMSGLSVTNFESEEISLDNL